jgi:hypothetical protein
MAREDPARRRLAARKEAGEPEGRPGQDPPMGARAWWGARARPEGKDCVGLGGGLEVGELGGGLESLGLGEAAGLDEIVLDGKRARPRPGEEAVGWGDWSSGAAEVEERSRAAM